MTNGLRIPTPGIAGAAGALAILALLGAACGGGGTVGGSAVPPVAPAGRPIVYVAVGASDSVGIGASDPVTQAWPQVFYRTALPRAAVFFGDVEAEPTEVHQLRPQIRQALRRRLEQGPGRLAGVPLQQEV